VFNGVKKEASTVGAIKGFSAPFGSRPSKKKKQKKNPSKPYDEPELFENAVIMSILKERESQAEVVRKRPDNQWAIYDDDTEAQLSVHATRGKAWERQRQIRKGAVGKKKAAGAERKRQLKGLVPDISKPNATKSKDKPTVTKAKPIKSVDKPRLAKRPATAANLTMIKNRRRNTEQLVRSALYDVLKESTKEEASLILRSINETSMISYIFENPTVDESIWENFVSKLSQEVILSDMQLKKMLTNAAKAEVKMLSRAVDTISEILGQTGVFEVKKGVCAHHPDTNDLRMSFKVGMKENNKNLGFSVGLENSKPLIIFPEDSRNAINSMANHESKLLRAELMHAQETALDIMDDVIKAVKSRDNYLSLMERTLDKDLNKLGPMQIALLKYLLKKKYKEVR